MLAGPPGGIVGAVAGGAVEYGGIPGGGLDAGGAPHVWGAAGGGGGGGVLDAPYGGASGAAYGGGGVGAPSLVDPFPLASARGSSCPQRAQKRVVSLPS
jgi:hypothetical protein